jgi:hypothetical protein
MDTIKQMKAHYRRHVPDVVFMKERRANEVDLDSISCTISLGVVFPKETSFDLVHSGPSH